MDSIEELKIEETKEIKKTQKVDQISEDLIAILIM